MNYWKSIICFGVASLLSACANAPAVVKAADTRVDATIEAIKAVGDIRAKIGEAVDCGTNIRQWMTIESHDRQEALLVWCHMDKENAEEAVEKVRELRNK